MCLVMCFLNVVPGSHVLGRDFDLIALAFLADLAKAGSLRLLLSRRIWILVY